MTFWSIDGHASFQTAVRIGPSTIERSKALPRFGAGAGACTGVDGGEGAGRLAGEDPGTKRKVVAPVG
ncbi:MAG TPA: hypothetical protein VFQ22_13380 [Longimicrobiales bacterium]|nr:hypothetical protein [Longimicrobiales bacterium]